MALRGPLTLAWLKERGVSTCPGASLSGGRFATQVGLATQQGAWASLGGLCIADRGTSCELLVDLGVAEAVHFRLWPAEHQGTFDGQQQLHALASDFNIECADAAWPWLDRHASALRRLHPYDVEVEVVLGGLGVRLRGLGDNAEPALLAAIALWTDAAAPQPADRPPLKALVADRETLDSLFPLELQRLSFSVATPRSAIGSSEALRGPLAQATAAYSGVVARVGDVEIARVSLDGHGLDGPGAPFHGELHMRLFASGHPRELALDVSLPAGLPRVALRPEAGLRGAIAALREIEVGDRELDDAFVIRGEGDVPALLDDVRPELLSLTPLGLTLATTGERLELTIKSPREDKLAPAIDALFTIWRRLAQLGLRTSGHRGGDDIS
jgi:hypothetical protein